MSKYLKLDSSKRVTGSYYDFYLNFNTVLPAGSKYILRSANIVNSYYNIDTDNNKFYASDSNIGQYTLTITPGFYTPSTIISTLQTALNTSSSGYVLTYNSTTGKFTMNNATYTFQLLFGSNTASSIASYLGINSVDTNYMNTYTSDNIVNLTKYTSYNIILDNTENEIENVSGSVFSFVVPQLSGNLQFSFYEGDEFVQRIKLTNGLKSMRVRVVDDNYNQIKLMTDFYLILEKIC